MRFTRSLVITAGEFLEGDVYLEEFQDAARRQAWDCPQCRTVKEALALLNGDGGKSLVLLATAGVKIPALEEILPEIAQTGATIIVYAHSRHESVSLAIRCSRYCADYVLQDRMAPQSVGDRVAALNLERRLYTQITLANMHGKKIQLVRGNSVFIATPFASRWRPALQEGVEAALQGLGLKPLWGDDISPTCTTIFDKAGSHIFPSSLLIANIVEDEFAASRHNPNVYFEAGLAGGRGIPILFVRPKRDNVIDHVPAELQGIHIHEYETALDLALKLYHGLKDRVSSQ